MNEPPTTEEGLRELQRRNHEELMEAFHSQNERIRERIREEIQQLQSAREGLRGVAPFTYERTTELPIPFAIRGGRDPGPEDMEDGKCWCYEAAQIDICPDCLTSHGTGEGAWMFCRPIANHADRWLPAHVRYLPARVKL